jgi:hypothetical protein
MTVTVSIDTSKIRDKIEERIGRAQLVLDNRIAADTDYWWAMDTGNLIDSKNPIQGNGEIEYKSIYARTQYYLYPNKSKDSNPNATTFPFEHAKSRNLKDWEKVANEEYNR